MMNEKDNEFVVDPVKQRKMFTKIFWAENSNLQTDNKSDKDMKQRIIDIIESEADKCS